MAFPKLEIGLQNLLMEFVKSANEIDNLQNHYKKSISAKNVFFNTSHNYALIFCIFALNNYKQAE